jgi:hypothetical protein
VVLELVVLRREGGGEAYHGDRCCAMAMLLIWSTMGRLSGHALWC